MSLTSSKYLKEGVEGGDATNSRDRGAVCDDEKKNRFLCRYHVMRKFIYVDTTVF